MAGRFVLSLDASRFDHAIVMIETQCRARRALRWPFADTVFAWATLKGFAA